MVKEEKKWISELDLEFPPWEHANFKDQAEHYFKIVR
jgi:hypothetical protein